MAYLSLYRKYRSQGFDELLGQKHVTQTLKNALAANRVAHAYLFTGPRGTGKTSSARLMAKALNCLHFSGPTPEPCGVCEACVRIRDGISLDVMEIDAASTRGIDDIRDLREKVKFAPAQERIKVYVIDEVHQLTGEAFNALLKTLEEPPPNVVFVLATTELHKVPATILSRCQRFDFRRGSLADLKERIETVCKAEGWEVAPEAVTALSVGANGGYRDALSLLEQVAAYTSGKDSITMDDVNTVLGSVADEQLLDAVDAIANRDAASCFRIVDEALAAGAEVRAFLSGLRRRLRDLLMLSVGADGDEAVVLAAHKERLQAQSHAIPAPDIIWCLDQLNEAERDLRWSPQQRLLLETTLVKLATRGTMAAAQTAPAAYSARPPAQSPARPPQERPQPPQERLQPPRETTPPPALRIVNGGADEAPPLEEPPYDPGYATPPSGDEMDEYVRAWSTMVAKTGPSTAAKLRGTRPLRVDKGILLIGGPEAIMMEMANKIREKLEESFEKALRRRVPLKFVHEAAPDAPREPARNGNGASGPSYAPQPDPRTVPLDELAGMTFDAEVVHEDD